MLKQHLQFKLGQKLSPQQIQLMRLMQLPTIALEQRIKEEIEENPALEETGLAEEEEEFKDEEYDERDDTQSIDTSDINIDEYLSDDLVPSYKTSTNNYSLDDDDKHVPYAQGISLYEHLMGQLHIHRLNNEEMVLADFLIGNIAEDGYIRRDLLDIVDDIAFGLNVKTTEEELEGLLKNNIHKLEPLGIGARNLRECLLIQMKVKTKNLHLELAKKITEEAFDAFSKKHFKKILAKFSITEEQLKGAMSEIEKLNPKPGKSFATSNKLEEQIIPDFTIKMEQGEPVLYLNARNAPELKVSNSYREMFETYKQSKTKTEDQKRAVLFVKQKLDSAKWFIEAIKQRQNTLMVTMNAILTYQKAYFLTGDDTDIRPMIIKDIAEIIHMDISTVSRVANSKYISTPYGTFLIKKLFSESLTTDTGEEVSTIEVKSKLKVIVEREAKKKPLTDEKLVAQLKGMGYNIARRTVAKYREELNIPVARLRKEI